MHTHGGTVLAGPSGTVLPMEPRHETYAERRIREAIEAGEFDDLPGAGEPIADVDGSYDPTWWVRKWVEREGITPAELAEARRRRTSSD
jgi:hypothetical protein